MQLASNLIFWGGKKYKTELEYIESTGTQWIDTGMTPSDSLVVDALFCKTDTTTGFVFGARQSNATMDFCFASLSTYGRFDFGGTGSGSGRQYNTASIVGTSLKTFHADKNGLSLDGVAQSYTTPAFALNQNIVLFANNTNGTIETYANVRMGRFRLSDGSKTIDLIPVLDLNGEAKMFDRVTGTYPDHFGTFVAGPEIHRVEYLESTGTQYVDPLLNSTTDGFCDFEIEFAKQVDNPYTRRQMPLGYQYGSTARYGMWPGADIMTTCAGVNNSVYATFGNDNNWHTVKVVNGQYVEIDGVQTAIENGSVRGNIGLLLFATVTSNSGASSYNLVPGRIAYCKIYNTSGVLLRDFRAIRVGSGSAWEGAMLDEASRRVYRNAGTGSFLYGNDINN